MRSQWSLPSAVPFSSMSMPPSLRFPFPFSASRRRSKSESVTSRTLRQQPSQAWSWFSSSIYATFEEKYGEDFADCADNFIQDNDDIAGRVNPCAMSVETVRAVYGMGFDAVFLNDWKKELAECDIDPEAVSVDSEAHDMENGRDGLDGNAPEKDAPEKDDRDAQPPVDTDNR